MKKLMIAAAAAMAGATTFGGLCDPDAVGPDSCSVYNIKFTFKTLAAKTACKDGAKWLVTDVVPGEEGLLPVWYRNSKADKDAAGIAGNRAVTAADYVATGDNVCDTLITARGLIANADSRPVFWMDNATRKFEGIAWQCKAACFEGWFEDCDLNNNGRLNYVLWEKKNSLAISYPVFAVKYGETKVEGGNTVFVGTPKTEYFSLDAQHEMFIGRYGKKAQKVTAFWELVNLLHGQEIYAAGFGTYDSKNLRTTSVSGNAVGLIMPIQDGAADACGNKGKIFCALGFMCSPWVDWCCDGCYAGVELVPASGTWSLKYNAAATKKANKDKAKLTDFVPAYMFYSYADWKDAREADPFLNSDDYYWFSETTGTLFYKNAAGVDNLVRNIYLDWIAVGAQNVIDIVFDGVYTAKTKEVDEDTGDEVEVPAKYTYGTTWEKDEETEELNEVPAVYELENGVLPASVFPDDVTPAEEEEEEPVEEPVEQGNFL